MAEVEEKRPRLQAILQHVIELLTFERAAQLVWVDDGGEVAWSQWPLYVGAELLAGVAAALAFGIIAHTRVDRAPVRETATTAEV